MAVGFDIDDTVLFSSPASGAAKKCTPGQRIMKNPEFWEKMNNGWDEFSMPKEVARQLIAMHVKRGDSIYFVTGRSQTKTETVSKTCRMIFDPGGQYEPGDFCRGESRNTKTSGWQKSKSFYGDSDNDITAAKGVKPARYVSCALRTQPIAAADGRGVW
jgi:acid phosphatase (class B)